MYQATHKSPQYFKCWGGPDDCIGHSKSKSVGYLQAAKDIPCYFGPKLTNCHFVKKKMGCLWQPLDNPQNWTYCPHTVIRTTSAFKINRIFVGCLTQQILSQNQALAPQPIIQPYSVTTLIKHISVKKRTGTKVIFFWLT